MNLLELLKSNKGTVSSALGKELAKRVLNGDLEILANAKKYVTYDLDNVKSKNVRAGAAKILEKVAEKKPELIAHDLAMLKPGMMVKEPQTRWMILQVFGYCAKLNPKEAESILYLAKNCLLENAGVCLSGAVHLYLGRIGATSDETASDVLTILDDALKMAKENEIDWIFEGFLCIVDRVDSSAKELIKQNAQLHLDARKKSTQNRARKLLKKVN